MRSKKISKEKLIYLIKKHRKIKVVVSDGVADGEPEGEVRERILTNRGSSVMREQYYSDKHNKHKWSRYTTSCFLTYERTAKAVVESMCEHDGAWLKVRKIYIGKGFKRKVFDWAGKKKTKTRSKKRGV